MSTADAQGRHRTMRLVAVSAGVGDPSSSRMLADQLIEASAAALGRLGIDSARQVIDLGPLAHDIMTRLVSGFTSPPLTEAIEALTGADAVIAVTPIYSTSYSGLFKSFIDILDPASLADMPVILAATGGSERHSLALEHAVRPLFAYLRARPTATAIYAATSDWGASAASPDASIAARVTRAASELAAMVAGSAVRTPLDPFALPAGFDPSGSTASKRLVRTGRTS